MIAEDMIDRRPSYAEVKAYIRNKRCLRHPEKFLEVGLSNAGPVPVCIECYPEPPKLEKQPNVAAERLGEMVGNQLPAVREVTVVPVPVGEEQKPMSIEEFEQNLALVKHVVSQMQEQVHYGLIPGTRDKSLWEPGAEYLRAAFRISWSYELTKEFEDFRKGEFRYEFRAFTVPPTQPAEWVASAWSVEPKFRGMPLGDLPNNVKDRALKRAFVNLMRNVTGTSGWFKVALDNGGGTTAGALESMVCPIHKTEWFKRGKMRAFAHPIGKTGKWCDMEAVQKAQDAQEVPQEPQTEASEPEQVPQGTVPPETYTFEQKRKMLFDWAESKYGLTPDQVAAAAGITLDQITEATDLRWVTKQVEALYGG